MAKRQERIRAFLKERGLDAIALSSQTMKKWMDTMTGSGCRVIVTKDSGFLLLDGRYLNEAKKRERDLQIRCLKEDSWISAAAALLPTGASIGLESAETTAPDYWKWEESGLRPQLLTEEIAALRAIKEPDEVECVEKACVMTDQIFEQALSHLHVGMREYELSAWLQYYSIAAGAERMAFDPIVASGERTVYPHGRPTDRVIQAGEPIMIDFGIQYKNYQSDMTRMCSLGPVSKELQRLYAVVEEAQAAGREAIRPGKTGAEVDQAARTVIEKAGYGEFFLHGLGHGIGVGDGKEGPWLHPKSETVLACGMMVSCEPGIYVPGVGGARLEDDMLVTKTGSRAMNRTPRAWRVLEVRG